MSERDPRKGERQSINRPKGCRCVDDAGVLREPCPYGTCLADTKTLAQHATEQEAYWNGLGTSSTELAELTESIPEIET